MSNGKGLIVRLFAMVIGFLSLSVDANIDIIGRLKALEHSINKEPMKVYRELDSIRSAINVGDKTELLWFYVRKAQAEHLLYFEEEFERTVQEGRALLDENSDSEIRSRFLVYAGIISHKAAQYQQAIELFKRAIDIARKGGHIEVYVSARQEMAYALSVIEQFETSLKDLQSAYLDAQAINNPFILATVYESYGALYGYMRQLDKSIEYYKKALKAYTELGYLPYIAEATYGLAASYRYQKKYAKAIEYFSAYNQHTTYTPAVSIRFYGYYGLAMTLAESGDCNKAFSVIEQALAIGGQVDYEAELHKRAAYCLGAQGDYQQALQSLNQAEQVLLAMPELQGTNWVFELIKIRAQIEEFAGNYTEALHFYKDYFNKQLALAQQQTVDKVDSLRLSLESDRQQIEIELLKEQARVHDLVVKHQKQQNDLQQVILVFSAVLLTAIGVLVFKQVKTNRQLVAEAKIDTLAKCFNRQYTFDFLDSCISRAGATGMVSVILLDIDNFKQINDNHGHPAGDYVIKQVAAIGKQVLRPGDIIGRIGGEEFLCVINRVTPEQNHIIATRLLNKISERPFTLPSGQEINVTVSIGIADLTTQITSGQSLYALADKALYQSKNSGKNCVTKAA